MDIEKIRQACGMAHVGRTEFTIHSNAPKEKQANWWLLDLPTLYKQVEQLLVEARQQAIIDATGGIGFVTPMKSMRTRNTAFKKYAVKYFNTKIRERRDRMLAAKTIHIDFKKLSQ